MLVKNVLKGMKNRYDITEITIMKLSEDQGEPKYTGSFEGFMHPAGFAKNTQKEIMNSEVVHRWIRSRGEASVFIVIE